MVFTLAEEDVVVSFRGRKKEVVYLRKSRRYIWIFNVQRHSLMPLI
jgi:hypothetical protein